MYCGLTTEVSGRRTAQLADCPLDRIVGRSRYAEETPALRSR